MADIEIEIDGNVVKAKAGEMLIAVTDREGISVPRFCYHKKLSIAANCRMCLVDVEGAPKPQPACSTPINEGMKVHTQNEKAKASQKAVMEFLLINHPLDCPICDQGGECELQDVAMSYGSDVSRFTEGKRVVTDSDIGALIHTDMTRCIHCTRCVRFGSEIGGIMEMGGTGRGEDLKIEPFLKEGITSELSGNMIDVCPVGALTSKPFRYELRTWQMHSVANIARHDLVGSNIFTQTYKGKVKRIVARDNDGVNETWISDRDRFSYEGLAHENRLLKPQIKVDGQWKAVEWDKALEFAVRGLVNNALNADGGNKLGALASNTATLEEFHLLQKMLREVGSENMDYRLNVKDLDNVIDLESTIKLAVLEEVEYSLIIGSNLRLEQPMINHRLRKAVLAGASIDVINAMSFDFNYRTNSENIVAPDRTVVILAEVLKSILERSGAEIPEYLSTIKVDDVAKCIADKLLASNNSVIILGEHAINNPQAASIAKLIREIAQQTGAATLNVSATSNSIAAEMANFVPGQGGLNANAMLAADLSAYILLEVYPQYDFHDFVQAIESLDNKNTFVISMNSFKDKEVARYSDVMLPIASFYETSGSHINIEGVMQSFAAAVSAPSESKPAWKVLKVLADLLELPGFHYASSEQITSEISNQSHQYKVDDKAINITTKRGVSVIWQKSPYAIDVLSRHATALQVTKIGQMHSASMNKATAKKEEVKEGGQYLGVPVIITEKVADNCVFVNANQSTGGRA
ncbi:NADH-quinone oxidoreductase subunit NuoG [bacterium endosymbiont of Bathymodiolus sp. 5 South]|jgi:NADH-quinone oxidoreductase subunit G|uniref:NADH-quinone oxidoreductase subunit NuoG n=1 Tax=bacterium endosymbiont of Bathymodiolus sp. 5 South TaxID=1181670 RepID=UPI0010B5CD7A|nr:NADH-quinone oxidoreductase subunit NuoG [bacterium endosymbiont of Bathymodiolus sp. 5 South]CAC9648476.1 NADH-ubiquinone oxidoreductase chain G (EC 1.6.5.3) [uncultured Gammaproteobacteria bacterium]CAC9655575.1 NADH-ubiquinone oxidoreductase chain G (EC 1.6.5.3) [uncultured Gammaproteobacteria bacterium]SHN92077.1 NADH-ubiquinone oxidoreductase chain G [bacterium endosymbiont of Bathymodiolus sp. 5 South]SSC08371.1 NADH-ubiquinone oxidoreductase chain G [bacterium endosymbiont of Bathymod